MNLERIQPDTPGELARRAAELGVSDATLAAAMAAVGTEVDKVKAWLASPERFQAEERRSAGEQRRGPANTGAKPPRG